MNGKGNRGSPSSCQKRIPSMQMSSSSNQPSSIDPFSIRLDNGNLAATNLHYLRGPLFALEILLEPVTRPTPLSIPSHPSRSVRRKPPRAAVPWKIHRSNVPGFARQCVEETIQLCKVESERIRVRTYVFPPGSQYYSKLVERNEMKKRRTTSFQTSNMKH